MALLGNGKFKVAVFDVEGVLIPKNRFLLFEVGRTLGFTWFMKIIFHGFLYGLGLISVKSVLKRVCRNFKGFTVEKLLKIFRGIPLIYGAEEVFEKLKMAGLKTVLISSGLPDFVVKDLASRLKADYAFGFDLKIEGGAVTGDVSGDVIEPNGKLLVLKKILEKEGIGLEKCVTVVDDRNNLPIMLREALNIGFQPDFLVRIKADYVVKGSLPEILSLVGIEESRQRTLPSKNEIVREVIHVCGFAVPLLSSLMGLHAVVFLILAVTFLYLISEWLMMQGKSMPVFSLIISRAASYAETHEFAFAPVFFAFGILFTLLVFPSPASSAAIAIFALGDSGAAIFGRSFGKTTLPFDKGKTLEGSISGIFFGFLGALFFVNPFKAFAGAVAAMLIESLPLPLNDNLTVPLTAGAIITLMV